MKEEEETKPNDQVKQNELKQNEHKENELKEIKEIKENETGDEQKTDEKNTTLETSIGEKTLVIEENLPTEIFGAQPEEEEKPKEEEEEMEKEAAAVEEADVSKCYDDEDDTGEDELEPVVDEAEERAVSENGVGEKEDEEDDEEYEDREKPSEEEKQFVEEKQEEKLSKANEPIRSNTSKIFSPLDFLSKSESKPCESQQQFSSHAAFSLFKSVEAKDSPLNLSIEHMLHQQQSSTPKPKPGTPDLTKLAFNPSASPKPTTSSTPINPFLASPHPANSPAPNFNPMLQPAFLAAFQQFFNPEFYQNFYPKPPNTPGSQTLGSQSPQLNSSACSSPAPIEMDELQPPIACSVAVEREPVKAESNAGLIRVWDRGSNSCSRTDIHFRYLPNAFYLR